MAGRKLGSKNKVRRISDVQMDRVIKEYKKGSSTTELAGHFHVDASTIQRRLREAGVTLRPAGFRRGEEHHAWVGGRHETEDGYIRVWVPADDPLVCMAQKHGKSGGGYVLEHRLVMARKLGRALRDEETVHHKDGNKQNNIDTNLELRQGKHGKGTSFRCCDCGSYNVEATALSAN